MLTTSPVSLRGFEGTHSRDKESGPWLGISGSTNKSTFLMEFLMIMRSQQKSYHYEFYTKNARKHSG